MAPSIRQLIFSFLLFTTLTTAVSAAWYRKGRELTSTDKRMLTESKYIDLVTYIEAEERYQGPTIDLKPSQFPNSPDLSRNAWDHANKQDQGFIHVRTEKPSWLKKVFFRAKPQVYLSSKVRPTDGIAKELDLTEKQTASLLWKYNPKTQEKKLIHISKYTYNDQVVWLKRPLQDALKPLDKVAEPLQEIVGHVH